MADVPEVNESNPSELLAAGRRHLAVKDYAAAAESLSTACELLAKEHGETADQCAEAYLWYGKALLGLSRDETGVLGDGVPGSGNAEEDDDDNEEQENGENRVENGETEEKVENGEVKKVEAESTTKKDEAEPTAAIQGNSEMPGTSNDEGNDESAVDLDEDDVDNLQHAWEMLEMARSIFHRRVENGGGDAARAILADVHLSLGEVALESETYDKAVIDMQSCLEIQKDLYSSADRRIAETHYQIGLANSLASNFDDAVSHFKSAANILESRIKTLENPSAATEDATVKKFSVSDPLYSVEGEIKELKELLPEIQEKIQDMMDYKAETIKRVRESLCGTAESLQSNGASGANGATGASSSSGSKPAADISHLIKRKRKSSESEEASAPKRSNT